MKFSKRLKIILIIFFLILIFIFLNLPVISKKIKNFFYLISEPFQKFFWQIGDKTSDFFEIISEFKNLKKEKEELKLEIEKLLAENAKLKEIKKENEILREALKIGLEKEFKLVLAEIIGKDISQDFLIINKGSKDGILKELPVISQQKILIGKIEQVYENFSKVMLISHKKSTFSVIVQERNIESIVKGKGNFQFFLDFIPREAEIKEGDDIVTISLGGIFPAGFLVGEIKEIKKSDLEPFQQVEIKPFFDIKQLKKIFIII